MDSGDVFREIDEWIARPLPPGIEETLEGLREEEEERRQAVRDAQESLTQVQFQIAKLEDALNLRRYVLTRKGDVAAGAKVLAATERDANGSAPNRGREAVLRLFSEFPPDREWTIAEVVSALATRGWAGPDDHHAVSVSLSRLARAGNVRRLRKGVYQAQEPFSPEERGETSPGTANSTPEGLPFG
jgi:hypothetical protein